MKRYALNEIIEHGSCITFVEQVLNTPVKSGRCAAVWRNGEHDSVAIERDKWYDHVAKEGGGIVELCAISKFGSITQKEHAKEFLGEWLGLKELVWRKNSIRENSKPKKKTRYDELIELGYVEKARYHYTDETGKEIYFVVRLEHPDPDIKKEFLQGTPEHWGIKDVTPVLYNLPEVIKAETVFVVEGEKDVETLRSVGIVATTNSGGAKKWNPEFTQLLAGKTVVVIADNDEVGIEHGKKIADSLKGVAASIKMLTASGLKKGDVTDFFQKEDGNKEKLLTMVEETPEYIPVILSPTERAKEANKEPFRNYIPEENPDNKGEITKVPVRIKFIIDDIHTRLLGAPFRVGETLFDQDRETGEIRYIYDQNDLFGWIMRKTQCFCEWAHIEGCVSKAEFFTGLREEAKAYNAISAVPDYPPRKDVYYTHGTLPDASENHAVFQHFLDFFCPVDEVNKAVLAAFIMAPIFYDPAADRPLWIIDSPDGQGSGKSKIPEMVALLYGNSPIDTSLYELEKNYNEVTKRIISPNGRNARILRIDNAVGTIHSANLATLVTSRSITGRPSYGRGEESRPNNLTYVITVNGATVDTDIASRAYYFNVAKPKQYTPEWAGNVERYIDKNRLQIFADIIDIITAHTPFGIMPVTRMPKFEQTVLQPACKTPEMYQQVIEFLRSKKEETNSDEELARRLEEELIIHIQSTQNCFDKPPLSPENDCVFIRSQLLEEWFKNSSWMDRKHPADVIRNLARTGMIPNVDVKCTRYPQNDNIDGIRRRSGIMWNPQKMRRFSADAVRVLSLDSDDKGREIEKG